MRQCNFNDAMVQTTRVHGAHCEMFVCGAFKKRGCVSLPPGIFPLSLVRQLASTPVM